MDKIGTFYLRVGKRNGPFYTRLEKDDIHIYNIGEKNWDIPKLFLRNSEGHFGKEIAGKRSGGRQARIQIRDKVDGKLLS